MEFFFLRTKKNRVLQKKNEKAAERHLQTRSRPEFRDLAPGSTGLGTEGPVEEETPGGDQQRQKQGRVVPEVAKAAGRNYDRAMLRLYYVK